MITKTELIKTIENMPEQFSIDDLLDKILLLQKIETGILESNVGATVSSEEAKRHLEKWLK